MKYCYNITVTVMTVLLQYYCYCDEVLLQLLLLLLS